VIRLEHSLPINPPGTASPITRAEVWHGLVLKADNALPFVPQMTYCKVIERETANRFVREIEFRGDRMRERVELEAERHVQFTRLSGPVLGTIDNFIDERDSGLHLRFAFALELVGVPPGGDVERDYAANMRTAYVGAVDATLEAIRKLHDEAAAPAWITRYYADVDARRMDAFLSHHTPDAKVVFGNHPPAVGHDAIRAAIGELWSSIAGVRHRFVRVWDHEPTAILECAVTYDRKDGASVTVPCVSILERSDDKIRELRIHIDLAPVFAP